MRKSLLILAGLLATFAHAQTPTDTLIHEGQGWRVHAGDDPAYAASTFDDHAWQTTGFDADLTGPAADAHSRWFRKRITLPAQPGPIDLILIGTAGSYEVYLDGHLTGPPIQSSLRWLKHHESRYSLRSAASPGTQQVEVAIRSHLSYSEFFSDISLRSAVIGDPAAISTYTVAHQGRALGGAIFDIAVLCTCIIVGLLVFSLYLQQRRQREYLWLALSVLFCAFTTCMWHIELSGLVPTSWNCFLGDVRYLSQNLLSAR